MASATTISTENALPGTDPSVWGSFEDDGIEGYATDISVNAGSTIYFKVKTASPNWRVRIYRMGWYQGLGARQVADIAPSVPLPQSQPANPIAGPADTNGSGPTYLYDAGNWAVSASWAVPANAVSGVYVANFDRLDSGHVGESNRTLFVVRNDGRAADIMLQTSDTTWHAYNRWGGSSLYWTSVGGRAHKVSYNRPFKIDGNGNSFWDAEYALVRWLERNGYDVCYTTGVDTDRRGGELLNKKIFVSSGHDEYWSKDERTNVEAARDAGVHLIFMSGNEVFWKVRYENSIDGTNTPRRTLVCYKETLEAAKLDPSTQWTGTWRDPRFSPPSDGGRPELSLIGQIFGAINDETQPDITIKVPAQYGAMRFWKNTDVATLPAGQTATLTQGTLGYEWDDDRVVGTKPGGLLELSSTTATVPSVLTDLGGSYAQQAATHRLTLYRAGSGALVWGTGTCQWAWGLDDNHLRVGGTPQTRMQQATANMLADMGALPHTLQSGLVNPTTSTDHTAPTSHITSPIAGATVPVGSIVTVTGTASDAGGVVAGVEVSVDGGTTWKRAAGTTSWSFSFIPTALGTLTIKSRAIDDSVNAEVPGTGVTITGVQRSFPCTIWNPSITPTNPSVNDANPIEIGVKFRSVEEGFITGVRFFKGAGNGGTHVGHLWATNGTKLAEVTFSGETTSGWQQMMFPSPVAIATGTTYIASVFLPQGHYAGDTNYLASAYDVWPLRALADGEDGTNGVFRYGSTGLPDTSFSATNYWVDVVFDNDDHRAPTVIDRNPQPGLDAVALDKTMSAKFSEAMTDSSIVMELKGAGGVNVPGTTSYDSTTRRATFTPASPLDTATTYTARVAQAKDRSGQSIAAPVEWTFTSVGTADSYPLTVWDTDHTVSTPNPPDTLAVELGVKFTPDQSGTIKGVRFYKGPANTGGHVAHLWKLDGTLLGTASYANESETGWQQANFASPVAVTGGQTYIASYYAPAGGYSAGSGAFSSSGADRGVLHIPSGSTSGGNGVFRYGASGLPNSSFNDADYGVDVVFLLPPDTTAPVLVDRSPGIGLNAVPTTSVVQATFNENISPATLTFTLTGPGGAVPATISYSSSTKTATLTPSASLTQGTLYTVSVKASDTQGNAMATPVTWSFTTVTPVGSTPATIWDGSVVPATPSANDASAIELGVKFRTSTDGHVTGIRFYKGAGNTGTHVGTLWKGDGTSLGAATFTTETAGGWQQANFAAPIPVTAGQTYVASYYAPAGHYAVTSGLFSSTGVSRAPLQALRSGLDGGNGVYRYGASGFPSSDFGASWYGVDVVFVDASGPAVIATTPAANATSVALDVHVAATFGEAVDTTGLTFTLRDDTAAANVAGSVSYDADTNTATFSPSAPLAPAHSFTAKVNGAKDLAGNPMSQFAWSFTTVAAGVLTFWPPATVPAVTSANDNGAIEIGTKFRVDVAGSVIGVRFYKGTGNTGTHVGKVWRTDGALLGQVTFSNESGSGWQQANFATPVAVVAGTTYVVSYYAPNGHYAVDGGYFSGHSQDNGSIHALADGTDGGNGVYLYATGGGLPTNSFNASNYWVDIAFQEGA